MGSSGERLTTCDSIYQQPRFSFNNSLRNFVSHDNKNEELNWGLFDFNNGVESPKQSLIPFPPFISKNSNQFMDSPFVPFNSSINSSWSHSNLNYKEEKPNISDFNIQSQTRTASFSISHNEKEESMKRQGLDWNVESQHKSIDFPMKNSKFEPGFVQSPQTLCNSNPIQATNEKTRYQDGYNWRKYGQKQVKKSNNPQSYYRCTYPNCPTKKKVEKDSNGFIAKVIYKEKHNHSMPQNIKKSSSNSFNNTMFEHSNCFEPYSEPSFIEDEHEHEHEAKRWKSDEVESDAILCSGSESVQEPRLVIETKSDIDILDDGYKWRKYGQKVVKGNPNPRSYYKCTYLGCRVRKLVERASHDFQVVITTYEAKHNHGVPTPRRGGIYAINEPSTSITTATSNNCGPVISRPLPNYSNNIHCTKGLTGSQTHVLQALVENSTNYGHSEKFFSESSTRESVLTTAESSTRESMLTTAKEEPESDFIFNSFLD